MHGVWGILIYRLKNRNLLAGIAEFLLPYKQRTELRNKKE